jgi:hypothetical protein
MVLVAVLPVFHEEVIDEPGAKISRQVPQLVNDDAASVLVVEPTVIAEGARRRREAAGIGAVVARGHRHRDAGVGQIGDRSIHRGVGATTETHIGHGRQYTVGRDPVDTGNDTGPGAGAAAVEHAHRMQGHALGDAVGGAADGAGDVGAVAVAVVGTAADGVETVADAPGEFIVGGEHAGIDDVGMHAGCGGVVGIRAAEREIALIDAVQTPGRTVLSGIDAGVAVFFDVRHARIGQQFRQGAIVGIDHETAQYVLVAAQQFRAVTGSHAACDIRNARFDADFSGKTGCTLFENDDVAALDGIFDGTELASECSGGADCEQNTSRKRGSAGGSVSLHDHHPCS